MEITIKQLKEYLSTLPESDSNGKNYKILLSKLDYSDIYNPVGSHEERFEPEGLILSELSKGDLLIRIGHMDKTMEINVVNSNGLCEELYECPNCSKGGELNIWHKHAYSACCGYKIKWIDNNQIAPKQ